MDSENNNQDNADSVAALKDLTAELENLKASDLAAETASDATITNDKATSSEPESSESSSEPEPSISTEETTAAELPDKPNLEVPSEPIVPDEPSAPAFDPSTLETPAASEEESASSEEMTSADSDTVADFTDIPTDTSSNEEDKKDEEKVSLPPLKPAAPVPGSIGSAKSYEDYQTDEANRAEKQADKAAREADRAAKEANTKKTTSTGLILGIVIAAIAVIAAVIFALVVITGKPKNTATTTPTPEPEPVPVFSSITCTKSIDGAELSALGEATEANITFTATYYDDELNDMSEKTVIEYPTVDDANASAAMLKQAYDSTLALINLDQDPFNSTYPVVGTTLTISHLADADDITEENFAIFGLQVDEEGNVKTSINDIQDIYTDKDFTCVTK